MIINLIHIQHVFNLLESSRHYVKLMIYDLTVGKKLS